MFGNLAAFSLPSLPMVPTDRHMPSQARDIQTVALGNGAKILCGTFVAAALPYQRDPPPAQPAMGART
jgi:hypothetical protein